MDAKYGLLAFLGLLQGSFLGLCSFRLPRTMPIFLDVSRCDFCGRPLAWWEKLPLLGYLLLRGRSRCCRQPIPRSYPMIEIATAAAFLLTIRLAPDLKTAMAGIVLVGFAGLGLLTDLRSGRIPNRITLPGMAAALLLAAFPPGTELLWASLGLLLAGGYLFAAGWLTGKLFHRPFAIGGGDIKFAAMLGAFLGLEKGLWMILLAAASALLYAVGRYAADPAFRSDRSLRFGPFLALSGLAMFWFGDGLISFLLPVN